MTLIDTSVWIEFLRKQGNPEVKNRVAAYIELEEAAYCGPVEFELLAGARKADAADIGRALGFSLLLDFPLSCWRKAAEIEKRLRAKGITIPRDDILVAAAVLHHNVPLYATDSHFALLQKKGEIPLMLV